MTTTNQSRNALIDSWGIALADWASASKADKKDAEKRLKAAVAALQEQQPVTFEDADQALAVARPLMDIKAERVASTMRGKVARAVVAVLLLVALLLAPGSAQARGYGRTAVYGAYGVYRATIYDQPNRPYFGRPHTRYATAPTVPGYSNAGNYFGDATWINPISGTTGSLDQLAPPRKWF